MKRACVPTTFLTADQASEIKIFVHLQAAESRFEDGHEEAERGENQPNHADSHRDQDAVSDVSLIEGTAKGDENYRRKEDCPLVGTGSLNPPIDVYVENYQCGRC